MAAAQRGVARRGEGDLRQGRVGQLDGVRRQRDGLGAHRLDAGLLHQLEHALHRDHPEDRRRAGDEAADALGGRVAGAHQERVGVAHPALDRLGELALEPGVDVAEGRRAGAAVEVLVAAADGEIDVPLVERDRDRTGGVAQVPEDQRARVVGDPGQPGGIGQPGRAVGDVVEHDQRRTLADRVAELVGRHALGRVDLDPAQGQAALGGDALGDVAVGREVVGVDDDLGARGVRTDGVVDGGAHQLVEPHGRRVADRGLAGRRAQADPREVVTERGRQVHPALVPAADESAAPLLVDEGGEPLGHGGDGPAERVAVEVDEVGVGAGEAVAERGEGVGGVEVCSARLDRNGHHGNLPSRPHELSSRRLRRPPSGRPCGTCRARRGCTSAAAAPSPRRAARARPRRRGGRGSCSRRRG